MISTYFLSVKFEPIVEIREPRGESFLSFLKNIRKTNFGTFTTFIGWMHFAVFIVSPLFVIYWLRYLELSYLQYTVIIASASITSFITITYWGAYADSYGNKIILLFSSYMLSMLPLAWFLLSFFPSNYYFPLGVIINIFGGFSWAGFNLSAMNLQFDTVVPEHRVRLVSYHAIIKGTAIFFGSIIGGGLSYLVFPSLPQMLNGIFLAMIISTIGRFVVTNLFARKITETRIVESHPHFLHFITVMPVQGMIFESVVGMNRTLKKFKDRLQKVEHKLEFWEEDLKQKTKNKED
jgi:MFS family permease